jgi:hypothetical protein
VSDESKQFSHQYLNVNQQRERKKFYTITLESEDSVVIQPTRTADPDVTKNKIKKRKPNIERVHKESYL